MSGEINDVLTSDGWDTSGLGTGGDLSLLTNSGEISDTLGPNGWDTVQGAGAAIVPTYKNIMLAIEPGVLIQLEPGVLLSLDR